jgi:hypothetical protein
MRVYVASSYADKEKLAMPWIKRLRESEITISHDWTVKTKETPDAPDSAFAPGATNELDLPLDIQRELALEDLEGVITADVVWIVAPPTGGCGCWIELGYAMSLRNQTWSLRHQTRVAPSILISGPRRTIFASLAEHFDAHDDAFAYIQKLAAAGAGT